MDAIQPYPPTSAGEGAQARPHRMFTVCGGTDTGSQRNQNQDTFVIADLESGRIERPCIRTDVWVARPGVLMLVCAGMGGPAAVGSPDRLAIAQVGDSRAYLMRDGKLIPLTRDQTLVADLGASGALKPDQVEQFPFRHVLAQALGPKPNVNPVITDVEVREGDRVLLCSVGLHGAVSEATIAAILAGTR